MSAVPRLVRSEHRQASAAKQPRPLRRASLPHQRQRQWPHRLRQVLHRQRPEARLLQPEQRKLRPHPQRRVERPQLHRQRRNRPESAELIVTAKVAPQLLQERAVLTKLRLDAPRANAAKLRARKEPAKVVPRKRAKGVGLNRNHLRKRPLPNQALLRNIASNRSRARAGMLRKRKNAQFV